jgi:hypothetical protein
MGHHDSQDAVELGNSSIGGSGGGIGNQFSRDRDEDLVDFELNSPIEQSGGGAEFEVKHEQHLQPEEDSGLHQKSLNLDDGQQANNELNPDVATGQVSQTTNSNENTSDTQSDQPRKPPPNMPGLNTPKSLQIAGLQWVSAAIYRRQLQ